MFVIVSTTITCDGSREDEETAVIVEDFGTSVKSERGAIEESTAEYNIKYSYYPQTTVSTMH